MNQAMSCYLVTYMLGLFILFLHIVEGEKAKDDQANVDVSDRAGDPGEDRWAALCPHQGTSVLT